MKTCLICSVGGSHQPIVKAIREIQPQKIIFICSADDPESGRKGSYISIDGKGNMLKSSTTLEKADLPNIPTQCQLTDGQYDVIKVASDDLDLCYKIINTAIDKLSSAEDYQIIVDYTGGTKTMSSALVLCAVDRGLQLNLIVGTRADHIKVTDGSEQSMTLDIQHIRYQRELAAVTSLWKSSAYHQAATQAENIRLTTYNRTSRNTFIQLSKAFAYWDRFDHQSAYQILQQHRAKLTPYFGKHLNAITLLSRNNNTPWKLFDLWNNAQRKANQGYYDDAIARLYRLLEWTAQWVIEDQKGYKTADLPRSVIPNDIRLSQNSNGQWQAGLVASWKIAQWTGQADVDNFVNTQFSTMFDHIQKRNLSILAHGFEPINQQIWDNLNHWARQQFLPLLIKLASQKPYQIRMTPEQFQLPNSYPEALLR